MKISIRKVADVKTGVSLDKDFIRAGDLGHSTATAFGNADLHVGSFDGAGSKESPRTTFTYASGKTVSMDDIAQRVNDPDNNRTASFAFVGAARPGGKTAVYVIEKPVVYSKPKPFAGIAELAA